MDHWLIAYCDDLDFRLEEQKQRHKRILNNSIHCGRLTDRLRLQSVSFYCVKFSTSARVKKIQKACNGCSVSTSAHIDQRSLRKTIFRYPFVLVYCWTLAIFLLWDWDAPGSCYGMILWWNVFWTWSHCSSFNASTHLKSVRIFFLLKTICLYSTCSNWCDQFSITNLFNEVLREAESWYTYLRRLSVRSTG